MAISVPMQKGLSAIEWAMWDYAGSFGAVTKKDGKAVADEGVLRAVGDGGSSRSAIICTCDESANKMRGAVQHSRLCAARLREWHRELKR